MYFVDTHTHLFAEEFQNDAELMIQRAVEQGVTSMLLPNIDVETIEITKAFAKQFSLNCFPMMGIHPCSVNENYKEQLQIIQNELFSGYQYVGIGEIGMDLYWDKTTENFQSEAFLQQCKWAVELNLPVSIHTRSATNETIRILKSMKQQPKGVFHCFSGSYEEGLEIIKMGFYLGIGGVITYKNSTLPETLKRIGFEHLVLETDAPYLPPTPHRGKRNESSYVPLIAQKLAEVFEVSIETIAEQTTNNAKNIFKF